MVTVLSLLLPIGVALGLLLGLAWMRNPTVIFIYGVAGWLASPVVVIALGLRGDVAGLAAALSRVWRDFAYTSEHTPAQLTGKPTIWDVVSPLVWLACFVVFAAADMFYSDLRFAALLGTAPHVVDSGLPAGTLAAALYVCLGLAYGLALFDLRRATPSHRPWSNFSEPDRHRLTWVCATGLVLTMIAALAAWCWGALQAYDRSVALFDVGLPLLLWALLAVLLIGGTLLAGFATVVGLGAVAVGLLALLLVVGLALAVIVDALISLLGGAASVLASLLDIPAKTGVSIWNWLVGFAWAKRLRLTPIELVDPGTIEITIAGPIVQAATDRAGSSQAAHAPDAVRGAARSPNGHWSVIERVEE